VIIVAAALLLVPLKLCLLAVLFQVPCPGCGMTRALLCMLRGDMRGAVALHALSPVVLPWVAINAMRHVAAYVHTGDVWHVAPIGRAEQRAAIALAVLLIALWCARFFGFFGGPVPV
jgi:hypothetical protein